MVFDSFWVVTLLKIVKQVLEARIVRSHVNTMYLINVSGS